MITRTSDANGSWLRLSGRQQRPAFLITAPRRGSRRINARRARAYSASVNARAMVSGANGSEPPERALAADQRQHLKNARTHGLTSDGNSCGMDERSGFDAALFGELSQRRFNR